MAKSYIGTAAVLAGFGSKAHGKYVAAPRTSGVLVHEQTLRQCQNTVQAGMSLYQSVRMFSTVIDAKESTDGDQHTVYGKHSTLNGNSKI